MQLTENTYFGEGNRYCLKQLLGRGGFSEVWLIKDMLTDTEDALKVYAPGTGMDNNGLKMFTKELSLVHNIHHTHILTASYVGVWQNMPYLVMPYCPKGSLVSKVGILTEKEAWRLIGESCAGLSYLHGQAEPIIHQDIKPDNILVDVLGNYVITDFGISTRSQSTLRKSVRNASSGTSAYMGPERFGQSPLPIKASDIWALGATIFELIEGYVPFGELGGLAQKSGADIPLMQANVSDSLKQVIYSMLAKETWSRPTAETLIACAKNPSSVSLETHELDDAPVREVPEQVHVSNLRETQRMCADSGVGRETQRFAGVVEQQPEADYSAQTEASDDNQSLPVTNRKFFLGVLSFVFCVIIVVAVISSFDHGREVRKQAYDAHENAITVFDRELSRITGTDTKDVDALETAFSNLTRIAEAEANSHYKGSKVYRAKKSELSQKADQMYDQLDDMYKRAPEGSAVEKKLFDKRNRVKKIQQKAVR